MLAAPSRPAAWEQAWQSSGRSSTVRSVAEKPRGRLVSVVVPVLDEQGVLGELHRRLDAVSSQEGLDADIEMVFVDDGSTDASREVLARLAGRDERVRVLVLARSFGQEAACAAGIDHARGDAVVVMDADLQDPPELIPAMVARWREGHDVVHARRLSRRGEPLAKRAAAWLFYRFMGLGSDARLLRDAGGFRLIGRGMVEALSGARDRGRFLRGLACWAGGRQAEVTFHRDPRHAGRSKYGPGRQAALAMEAVTGFSALPIRIVGLAGGLLVAGGAGSLVAALVVRLASPGSGIAPLLQAGGLALATGLVLAGLWIVGEYVYRLGREARGLPLYVVRERMGFDPDGGGTGARP
jgi:glycosyltransferase involved in cell wall biosynthesis